MFDLSDGNLKMTMLNTGVDKVGHCIQCSIHYKLFQTLQEPTLTPKCYTTYGFFDCKLAQTESN